MIWSLKDGQLELHPVFDMRSPNAGLYDWQVNFGCIKIQNDSSFLDSVGYGIVSSPPANFLPETTTTMQFYSMYGPQKIQKENKSLGIYWGIHDPRGDTKTLESYITDKSGAFRLSYTPPGSSEGNKLYETIFPITIKPFEGEWYDASNIYREWALPNADWTKKGRLADRTNIPQWTYNLTTWFMDGMPTLETVS